MKWIHAFLTGKRHFQGVCWKVDFKLQAESELFARKMSEKSESSILECNRTNLAFVSRSGVTRTGKWTRKVIKGKNLERAIFGNGQTHAQIAECKNPKIKFNIRKKIKCASWYPNLKTTSKNRKIHGTKARELRKCNLKGRTLLQDKSNASELKGAQLQAGWVQTKRI